RFQGYVGVANYMGARFGANEQAVSALMHEVGKRGLIYFDDGSTSRGLFGQVAGAANVPFVKADVVVDARQSAAEIDAALGRLEAIARERGTAVGSASAIPLSVDRIAQWAKGLAARGIALVPISAVAARPKSS
ncbi:MAG: divergent polysaccharide deacetylase family protein, partial [Variibacter sp.]|nr:divergent polysaccharide deacetylase family protein [Variibacter sp.]